MGIDVRAAITSRPLARRLAGALRRPAFWPGVLTVAALLLRLYRLAEPALRWDEGWSLAHASLSWRELWQVATDEWHPPLYVALLRLWLVTGRSAWSIRFLSVLLGVAAVPLVYAVGRCWSGRTRVGILAGGFAAAWPLLVYYGQVTRMYALAALLVLAASWCLLAGLERSHWAWDLGLVLSAAAALYTLYPTAWALLGLWLYGLLRRPRRLPRLLVLGVATLLLYIPWLLGARGTLAQRLGNGSPLSGVALLETWHLLKPTLEGLAFVYAARPYAMATLAILLCLGALAGPWGKEEWRPLLLPLLVLGLSIVGVAYSARSYWFAPRHLVPCCTFLGLLLAWALDRLCRRAWPLLPLALLALAIAYWPTVSLFVYEKNLEVTDAFDPTEDYRYLTAHAGPQDLVFFNVLARAGWYESLRRERDPRWSYAMRWDPIMEPMEAIEERVQRAGPQHQRLWFALYKGDYGPNAPLVEWLNGNLYPAGGEWRGDMLYLAYAFPTGEWTNRASGERFAEGVSLGSARWTPTASSGGAVALELAWSAAHSLSVSYKVFVHLVDSSGVPLAQHDALPAANTRPTSSWRPGEIITDRHGLFLPTDRPVEGQLHLLVGLYDPDTGARLPLLDSRDALEVGSIVVH